jgi:cytidylate kinase
MMENLFLKYLIEKHNKVIEESSEPGPVITISREHGCYGKEISQILVKRINKKNVEKYGKPEWSFISKEILYEASLELRINPENIKKLLIAEEKSFVEVIVASFTDKYYVHNTKIIGIFKKVIKDFASKGNVVILGRGGVAITKDIPRSLHIYLQASFDWRAERIAIKRNISLEKAKKEIMEIDTRRLNFIHQINKINSDYTRYDLTLNCMTFSPDEICEIIIKAAEKRNII